VIQYCGDLRGSRVTNGRGRLLQEGSPLSPGRWEGLTLREGFRELDIREGG